jgi:hypothetical protein
MGTFSNTGETRPSESGTSSNYAAEASEFQAVEVTRPDEPVYLAPSKESERRGAVSRGARLPVFGASNGPGCRGRWLSIAPEAYICEDGTAPSAERAPPLDTRATLSPDGLPYHYYFVAKDGAFGYDALETAEDGVPSSQLQPGFGLAFSRLSHKSAGDAFGLTTHGFWVPLRDLNPAVPTRFQGSAWTPTLGWVIRDAAPVFSAPGKRKPGVVLERLTALSVLEERPLARVGYLRVDESSWLRADDVRRPELAPPPAEALPGERWLDVDLAKQTLVAYVGDQAKFATLISSGRGAKGSATATPPGVHRIWVKLATSDMDNVDDASAEQNYAIEAVPWVMFFHHGVGLHGTFWHRRFGEVKSHGCVNLSPVDAERLFYWTSPRLLPGWSAVLPTPHELGTLVRVR